MQKHKLGTGTNFDERDISTRPYFYTVGLAALLEAV